MIGGPCDYGTVQKKGLLIVQSGQSVLAAFQRMGPHTASKPKFSMDGLSLSSLRTARRAGLSLPSVESCYNLLPKARIRHDRRRNSCTSYPELSDSKYEYDPTLRRIRASLLTWMFSRPIPADKPSSSTIPLLSKRMFLSLALRPMAFFS